MHICLMLGWKKEVSKLHDADRKFSGTNFDKDYIYANMWKSPLTTGDATPLTGDTIRDYADVWATTYQTLTRRDIPHYDTLTFVPRSIILIIWKCMRGRWRNSKIRKDNKKKNEKTLS